MTQIFRNSLLISPALLGIAFIVSVSAAAEAQATEIKANSFSSHNFQLTDSGKAKVASSKTVFNQTRWTGSPSVGVSQRPLWGVQAAPQAQPVAPSTNLIAQGAPVTSVSQLSDVQPSDWAFQALQSLIERYGCIAGYPDGTYRGDRALTRYEFAAGTYACLNSLAERAGSLSPEDLATIRRLQEEFAAELATLRGRVDGLEARTTELEENQFSTTTQLAGEVIIAPQYGEFADGAGRATAIARVRLDFNTSFTGEDLLFTQLELGNEGGDVIGAATTDSPFAEFANPGSVDYGGVPNEASLLKLHYTFKPTSDLAITIGPRIEANDFVDGNSYANDEASDFSSGFLINNPLIITPGANGGAGAFIDWNIAGGPVTLRAVYVSASPTNALPNEFGGGLFGDPYQATGELEFSPSEAFAVRFQYTTATIGDVKYSNYGANAELTLGRFGLFGRYGNGDLDGFGSRAEVDLSPETFMAGIGIRDLLVPDSLLAFAAGQPFIEGSTGDVTQTNYEAFYRFAVSDNITITPTFSVITDVNNDSGSDTVYQGVLRTVFFF